MKPLFLNLMLSLVATIFSIETFANSSQKFQVNALEIGLRCDEYKLTLSHPLFASLTGGEIKNITKNYDTDEECEKQLSKLQSTLVQKAGMNLVLAGRVEKSLSPHYHYSYSEIPVCDQEDNCSVAAMQEVSLKIQLQWLDFLIETQSIRFRSVIHKFKKLNCIEWNDHCS